jgi:hypothetical protein
MSSREGEEASSGALEKGLMNCRVAVTEKGQLGCLPFTSPIALHTVKN